MRMEVTGQEVISMVDLGLDGTIICTDDSVVEEVIPLGTDSSEVETSDSSIILSHLPETVITEAEDPLEDDRNGLDSYSLSTSQSTFVITSSCIAKNQPEFIAMKPSIADIPDPSLNQNGGIGPVIMQGDSDMTVEQSIEVVRNPLEIQTADGDIILVPNNILKPDLWESAGEVVVSEMNLTEDERGKGCKTPSPRSRKKKKNQIDKKEMRTSVRDISSPHTSPLPPPPPYPSIFDRCEPRTDYSPMFGQLPSKRPPHFPNDSDDDNDFDDTHLVIDTSDPELMSDPRFCSAPLLASDHELEEEENSGVGFQCGECGAVLKSRSELRKHIMKQHTVSEPEPAEIVNKTYKCPTCGFSTFRRDKLDKHVSKHLQEGFTPTGKKRNTTSPLQRMRYDKEQYKCPVCPYECVTEKAFRKHQKLHSANLKNFIVKVSCVICGKDRPTEADMKKHMKKHRSGKYYCCDICSFNTVQLKKVIQHRRMHTGERPHLCPHCTYRAARRDNLRSHVRRMHKKENMYSDSFVPKCAILAEAQPGIVASSSAP